MRLNERLDLFLVLFSVPSEGVFVILMRLRKLREHLFFFARDGLALAMHRLELALMIGF